MTQRNLAHGLHHLNWLTKRQGERFLQCRREGCQAAWRFCKEDGGKKQTDRPLLCGFIAAGTRCEK